ncbi:MAG: ABC transporter permease [Actinomycetaceae bacterium]|nr:ABC transporter permease [Actinomycetaceae bacterium]
MKSLFPLATLFIKMDLRNRAFLVPSFIFPILIITLMSIAGKADGARGSMSYASFLAPGILGMAYAAVTLVGLPVMISSYRKKGILRLFKSSRIPMITVALAIFVTQLFFMVLQTILLLSYSVIILGARFSFSNTSLLSIPVLLVGLLALLALGFFVSAFLPSTRSATMVGNLLNLVAIFLGGVFSQPQCGLRSYNL